MKVKLKISDVYYFNRKSQTGNRSDDFIPPNCRIVKIQIGDCESSFDLKSIHFRKGEYLYVASLNYTIKVKNFHKNDKVIIFWNNNQHEIEQNNNKIHLSADDDILTFYYELSIDENYVNDGTGTKKVSFPFENREEKYQKQTTPIENKEEKYQNTYIPIKKQKIHSFLEDDDIKDVLPKVDF